MTNPFTFGGQIAQTSTNEPERITGAAGQRVTLMSNDAFGRPVQAGSEADTASRGGAPSAAARPALDLASYGRPASAQPTSIAARGGPMSYSRKGEGTTNPNAFKVGSNNSGRGVRMLRRLGRNNADAAATLAQIEARPGERAATQDFEREKIQTEHRFDLDKYGVQRQDKIADRTDDRAWQTEERTRDWGERVNEFGMRESADTKRYERGRKDTLEDRRSDSIESFGYIDGPDGRKLPVAVTKGGEKKMTGGGLLSPPEKGMTADDIAAARALGGKVELPGPGGAKLTFDQPKEPRRSVYQPVPGRASLVTGVPDTPDQVFDPNTGEFFLPGQVPPRGGKAAAKPAKEAYGDTLFRH